MVTTMGTVVITMETRFPSLLKHMVSLGLYNSVKEELQPYNILGVSVHACENYSHAIIKYRALLT